MEVYNEILTFPSLQCENKEKLKISRTQTENIHEKWSPVKEKSDSLEGLFQEPMTQDFYTAV